MHREAIQRLYAYDRWANERILNTARDLSPEQFLEPDDTPFGSVRNELFHLLDVQRGWRIDWEQALHGAPSETGFLNEEDYPDLDSIVALWRDVESRTEAFLESVSEDQLPGVITIEFDWGDISAPLWEMMLHVVNHGTQHRSEVAMKLTNFGYSPGMLDLMFFSAAHSEPAKA